MPYLEKAENPHVLMLSPPLDMKEKWFAPHTAYSHGEVRHEPRACSASPARLRGRIAVNALWPRTTIATARDPATSSAARR